MSSSSSAFAPGLGLSSDFGQRASVGPGVAAPFAFTANTAAPRPGADPSLLTAPVGTIRPVVFGQLGAAVNARPAEEEPAADQTAALLEVVEADPTPPPPDYEALKAEAWREGFEQGYDEGVRLAAQEQQETATRLGALCAGIATETEQFIRGLEHDVVELALSIAEKVIVRELTVERGIVVDVVRATLAEIHDATELRIRVNPEDYALVEPRWESMLPRSVAERSELLADELVERGGCAVETRIGDVDGQLRTRLGQIVTAFQAVLDGEPA